MSIYQTEVNTLLEQCQNEWVKLESLGKEDRATNAISQASKDLREAIKRLVQLQDNLDENKLETSVEMDRKAKIVMDDVRKKLEFASNVTTKVKPTMSQSSPLVSAKPLVRLNKIPSRDRIIEEEEKAEDSDKDTSSSNGQEQCSGQPLNSLMTNMDSNISSNKKKSLFPLLKGLRPSQSTPIKTGEEVAHINFYKNDENFIYATDAVVEHPLRIGAGYGSYICYSCTVYSDKGTPITVLKRYSDFVELREELIKNYSYLKKSIPKLPPKKVVGKFTPTFVEQRRRELEYFFKYVVLHPTLGASPAVRRWIAP